MKPILLILLIGFLHNTVCLLPPKFQWKTIDFSWVGKTKDGALATGVYIPENNMPTGLARWKDKLFVTIPRWKKGVPSSLNYLNINGEQNQTLTPYPSWDEGFVSDNACCLPSNSSVVSTFRVHVDSCDRLWVVDNGVSDMANDVKQVGDPAIVIFDLNSDTLVHRYVLPYDVLTESSVLTSIVADVTDKKCSDAYVYITDAGSNAIIVYSLKDNDAWRVQNLYFHSDPHATAYRVGGIDFFWKDGVSSAALSPVKSDGSRDLYLHPTSSTKLFKMSTKLLKNKYATKEELSNGVEVVGDRGANTQATACDFDPTNKVLFFTQLSKNGVGCWNIDKPFNTENSQLLISDCNVLEFPNDIKVDQEGNIWILSDRQSRFLYENMSFDQVNFRILTAPVSAVIQGTNCEKGKKKSVSKSSSFTKQGSRKK